MTKFLRAPTQRYLSWPKALTVPLAFMLGLSACQTSAPPPPSAAQINQLALDVEAAAVADMTIMNHCSALGGPSGSYADAARESWQFANQELLTDAERLLNDSRVNHVTIDAMPYSLAAIARVHDLSVEAGEQLNLAGRSPNGQKNVCQRELTRIETETYSSLSDLPTRMALSEQAQSLTELETGVADILTRWARWPKPGRSYITLAESAKAQCTTQSRIITLDNNWPNERYAVYCGTEPVGLYECEWGTCEASTSELPERS
jgi:hypothetical protein